MKITDLSPFTIRIPADLKNALKKAAAEKPKGSVNSEILHRLAASFEVRNELAQFTDGELIDELLRRHGPERIFIRIGNQDLEGE